MESRINECEIVAGSMGVGWWGTITDIYIDLDQVRIERANESVE